MRIGVFIDNRGIASVDCSNLLIGNPGVGGTIYSILLLCQVYKSTYPSDSIYLFSTKEGKFPDVDCVEIVDNILVALEKANALKIDVFIMRPVIDSKPLGDEVFEKMNELRVPVVTWAHNFYDANFAKKIARTPSIVANVFVSRQEYDYYIDHEIINKSVYIYNMCPSFSSQKRLVNDGKTVTYIGSLVRPKGFHILAKAWKSILKEVPDAQLYVIGSGGLYSRDAKLGLYNIADEKYENEFMPYLLDDHGEILPSVHFLGSLGTEKEEYIKNTSVGVVNPSGKTETFGISALDFEGLAVPVVTIAYVGFLDTIKDGATGILYKRKSQISRCIVDLLKNKEKNEQYGCEAAKFAESFVPELIISDWHKLFIMINNNQKPEIVVPTDFYFYQMKWIRVLNRKIKNFFRNEKLPALVSFESCLKRILRR